MNCSSGGADRLPGDYCEFNEQCMSKNCVSNVCKGQGKGDSCDDAQKLCDPKFYCSNDKNCAPVIDFDADCTGTEYSCRFGSYCHTGADKKATCTKWFTVDDDTVIGSGDQLLLCKSGTVGGASGEVKCVTPMKFAEASRKKTDMSTYCKYSIGGGVPFDGIVPQCGYTNENVAYCPFKGGDLVANDFVDIAKLVDGDFNCSNYYKDRVFAYKCNDLYNNKDPQVMNALQKIFYIDQETHFAMVQDNPDCIKNSSIPAINNYHQFIMKDGQHKTNGKNPYSDSGMILTTCLGLASALVAFLY